MPNLTKFGSLLTDGLRPRFAPRFWALTWVTLYLNPARVQDQVIETWDSFNLEDWKWSR